MKQKRLDESIKNHEMLVQELLEYAKSEPKSFRDSIAEIIRVMSDYTVLSKRVQALVELEQECVDLNSDCTKLALENKRYREALEFYANEENYLFDEKEYKVGLGVPESEITLDYGNKARKALEGEE